MKTSSSGGGMSKYSPYISCSGMTNTGGTPSAIVVRRRDRPDDLALAVVAPPEAAARPHQAEERLRVVARVEGDEAHAVQHVLDDPVDHGVVHGLVRAMAPPRRTSVLSSTSLGEPVLGVREGRGANRGDIAELRAKRRRHRLVDPVWVDPLRLGLLVLEPSLQTVTLSAAWSHETARRLLRVLSRRQELIEPTTHGRDVLERHVLGDEVEIRPPSTQELEVGHAVRTRPCRTPAFPPERRPGRRP